jgi:hypothetical protein
LVAAFSFDPNRVADANPAAPWQILAQRRHWLRFYVSIYQRNRQRMLQVLQPLRVAGNERKAFVPQAKHQRPSMKFAAFR